ncbi:hypothetical protein BGAL_0727g00010 [Botrytis galanthina]|uniref:NADAR domain-containing protein n=1 Tax=Botrytis galanthina TaxID=278940 RepID=A0A4S8QTW2_9HELO|nr:hypothetical protein BGAL_0727g00010 [Botrytis galanthina]
MAPGKDSLTFFFAKGNKLEEVNSVLFSGHKPGDPYSHFSNFYMGSFKDNNGITYSCGEAYFQAGKAWKVGDMSKFAQIAHAKSGFEAKKLGNELKGLDVADWNKISSRIMQSTLYFKYRNNPVKREDLINTGNKCLVEAREDPVLGTRLKGASLALNTPISQWPGDNKLGEELMRARNYFKSLSEQENREKETSHLPLISPPSSSPIQGPLHAPAGPLTKQEEDLMELDTILPPPTPPEMRPDFVPMDEDTFAPLSPLQDDDETEIVQEAAATTLFEKNIYTKEVELERASRNLTALENHAAILSLDCENNLTSAQDIGEVYAETLIRIPDIKNDKNKTGEPKADRIIEPISKDQMLAAAEERAYTNLALEIQSHRKRRLQLEELYRREEDLMLERQRENQRRRGLETIRASLKIYDTDSEPESEVEREQLDEEQPEEEQSQPIKSTEPYLILKKKTCPPHSAQNSPDESISRPARKQPISSTPSSPIKLAKRKANGDAATETPKKPKF